MSHRKTSTAALVVLLLWLAYFPARFIWDISLEAMRGLWAGLAFSALVAAAAGLVVAYVTRRSP